MAHLLVSLSGKEHVLLKVNECKQNLKHWKSLCTSMVWLLRMPGITVQSKISFGSDEFRL